MKFQLYDRKVVEQAPNRWKNHLEKVRLTESQAKELRKEWKNVFFTPMSEDLVRVAHALGVPRLKIRANDAYNMNILLAARESSLPTYVSRSNYKQLDPPKQKNFYTIYYDLKRPTKYNEVFKGYSNLIRSDGYSCHCEKLYAVMQCMLFGGVDYIEVHVTLDSKDTSLPDWRYSFPFVDVLEMCKFRDLLNSRARENPSKWEIA